MITTTLEKIQAAVSWYSTIPQDYNDIAKLMDARRRLACHLFVFAIEVSESNKDKNRTEHIRKSKYARAVSDALKASGGNNVARAQQEAEYKVIEERSAESLAEATYFAGRLIYDAGTNVLDTISQHVSNLKSEKRLEYSGQGSQTI